MADIQPKYLNSSESPVFHKSEVLFGINAAGSAWNEQKFHLMKRVVDTICFMPDGDMPKHGQRFGHGVEVVMEAGRTAMECGHSVTIKEIPDTDHMHKQDPGTYFTSTNIFDSVKEQDYIIWYARKVFDGCNTTTARGKAQQQVAALLALVDCEAHVQEYIAQLVAIHSNKSVWKLALQQARKEREEALRESNRPNSDGYI